MAAYVSPPPAPPPPALPALDLLTVISEARRIINAHSRHFLALSVLFLLPVSFYIAVYPALISPHSTTDHSTATAQTLLRIHRSDTKTIAPVLFYYYTAFVYLFSLSATASISHSTIQGFYGRPVRFLPAIKSIFTCFFPLFATTLCTQLIIATIIAVLGLLVFLVIKSIELIQPRIDYSSPYFIGFVALIVLVLWLITLHLQVQWALVNVIVVAEPVWGFSALKRSTYLVKGMRKVALSLILIFGLLSGIFISANSLLLIHSGSEWSSWAFVLQIVVVTSAITKFMLVSLAANVVLYMYCKAIHGELALEIAQEFARDYVSLPFDEGKVPHVVTVAYT